ncbi:DUF19 domain-containing protein [Caenorhabditis elegans]|uniref:DUF19 domain-containing protein n=1 Tax=Caenorhabditis elegans TaxID=6239 RepID=P90960_CAEEL|nr:DUF19 domain-containing protein [Caenorhabditis elegans]CAA92138.2 DUF19 domain-containing protein [Caenorhabditis elegans]|eukprot:NP_509804.2 Uncharacterized protein CELE_T05A10.6 [Caenorhabditis elegans]
MMQIFVLLLVVFVSVQSQIHIADDNYFLERQRVKRDAASTTCPNGMSVATRNVFDKTVASGKTWDCTLESKAQAVIKECLLDNGGVTNGTLKLSFPVTGSTTPEATIQQFQTALQLASSNSNSKSQITESIGCSYAQCQSRLDILCLFSHSSTVPPLP